MSNLPLHPAIVHIPLGLAVVLPLLAIGLAIALWRGALPRKAWAIVVGLQLLMVGAGFVALRSGEGDEERAENRVSEALIEQHEERAQAFMVGAGAVLVLSSLVLFLRREGLARITATGAAAATLVVAGLALRTGHAGGQLVYGSGTGAVTSPAGEGGDSDD